LKFVPNLPQTQLKYFSHHNIYSQTCIWRTISPSH